MTNKHLLIAAISLFSLSSAHAQDVQLTIHADQGKNTIHKEIYGQFAEHLGSCIYGGIWVGKDSKIPNTEGYRTDVFNALKDLEIPVLRWPGGCFADEYHWMDGIGPQENRPLMVNTNWGGTVEDNSFGTHEFLNLCEMLGCEPYVSANVGSGSVEEMAKWVEYMTSNSNSTMAELRRKNGRQEPWKVKYFGVGNESWGCGGNMRVEYYTDLYRRYATYARDYQGNKLYRIASGANAGDTHWTEVCMRRIGTRMHGLSVHYYAVRNWSAGKKGSATDFTEQEYYETLSQSLGIEDCLVKHMAIMDKYDPKKRIGFLVDEWGTWWEVEPGTNPGHLFQQNTMRDAIVASSSLDIFHKYTDRITMANIAQVVNVLQAMILTKDDQMLLTPTYHVFMMYKPHKGATFLPATLTCDTIVVNDKEKVPVVSSTASRDKDGNIHLSLTNIDLNKSHVVAVNIDGMQLKDAEGTILNSKNIDDYNEFGKDEIIKPATFEDFKVKKGTLQVTLPAHSIVTLTLQTK